MIEREKVIKALDLCKYDPDPGQTVKYLHSCVHCPYWNDGVAPECSVMYTDAIAMLKEQEPVKPIRDIDGIYYCGNCDQNCVGYEVEFTHSIIKLENYCHKCGRRVKWK